jgi:hypothetical protein
LVEVITKIELGPKCPRPFSFASEARVNRILSEGGFSSIAIEPVDLVLDVPAGAGLEVALEGAL